jgi:hypothetical protein
MMPSTTRRSSRKGRPRRPAEDGSNGWMRAHCPSVKTEVRDTHQASRLRNPGFRRHALVVAPMKSCHGWPRNHLVMATKTVRLALCLMPSCGHLVFPPMLGRPVVEPRRPWCREVPTSALPRLPGAALHVETATTVSEHSTVLDTRPHAGVLCTRSFNPIRRTPTALAPFARPNWPAHHHVINQPASTSLSDEPDLVDIGQLGNPAFVVRKGVERGQWSEGEP